MAEESKRAETTQEETASAGEVEVKTEPSIDVAEPEPAKRGLLPTLDFDREFERAFENFFSRDWLRRPQWPFPGLREELRDSAPKVNVIDREDEIVVEAELPGVKKENLEVSLSDNTVTIKATSRKEESEEKGDYRRREISAGYLSRTVPLSAVVEGENAKAEFVDGMLTLTLPKAEESKPLNISVD